MIEKKQTETPLGSKRSYYYDDSHNREYRRIVAGVAWPAAENAGFIVVIAESENKIARLKKRQLWILAETETQDIEKLIRKMYDYQNRYFLSAWFGDTENMMMLHFVDKFNSTLSRKKTGIYLAVADFVNETNNLRVYSHNIKMKLTPEKKVLFFGDKSVIPIRLGGLSPDDIQKKKAEDYPAVAALGYVLSGIDEPYCDISKDRELHEQFINKKTIDGL